LGESQKFFDRVVQTVLKNCSVAGEPYEIDEKTRKVILKGSTLDFLLVGPPTSPDLPLTLGAAS